MQGLTLLSFLLVANVAFADLVLVVNPANTNTVISLVDLKKIYLGKTRSFPNGQDVKPFDISTGEIREEFLEKFLEKNESNLKAYWSRMIFSGKGIPPQGFAKPEQLKAAVAAHPSAIGFLDSSMVDETVKVILVQ